MRQSHENQVDGQRLVTIKLNQDQARKLLHLVNEDLLEMPPAERLVEMTGDPGEYWRKEVQVLDSLVSILTPVVAE